jgi:hypothetical protein
MADRHLREERAKQVLEAWKTIVGVQMHFNDIGMRIRAMFVTILLALLASIGFLLDKKLRFEFGGLYVQYYMLIPLFGIGGTMLFYLMDRYWFHRLLRGSVLHAQDIEKKYKSELPELSLSEYIGRESFLKPKSLLWIAAVLFVRHEGFRKEGNLHSDGKLEIFYKSVMWGLLLLSITLGVAGGVTFWRNVQWAPPEISLPETI